MKPPDINKYNLKSRCKCLRFFVAKVQKHMEKLKMPSYSNIFQPETSFALKLSIWKTMTKKLPDGPRYLKLFSNARIKLKIPDEGLSRFFNLRARSVASIRFFHKKAF